jgi:cytochrome c-type biogenesis protein CcmE
MASPKQQRLVLAAVAAVALVGAGVLAAATMRETATYFYAPADLAARPPAAGQTIRLGGLVRAGSIAHRGTTTSFTVTDLHREVRVSYTGIVPDLFRERQGVIATGRFAPSGEFIADELLAKHDEKYMPPEVARSLKAQLRATQPAHPSA